MANLSFAPGSILTQAIKLGLGSGNLEANQLLTAA